MKKYLRIHEVATQLGVSTSSVRLYVKDGKLSCDYTPSGQRIFLQSEVDKLLGKNETKQIFAYYARSSNQDSKSVEAQFRALEQSNGSEALKFKDYGSGLNENRKGLQSLLKAAKNREFNTLVVTQKDRLTRFGFTFLEELLKEYNVDVIVLGEEGKTLHEELLQDFMSLVVSFSGKFYRLRGYEQQKKLLKNSLERVERNEILQ